MTFFSILNEICRTLEVVFKGIKAVSTEQAVEDGFQFFRWLLFVKQIQLANSNEDDETQRQILTKMWEQVFSILLFVFFVEKHKNKKKI